MADLVGECRQRDYFEVLRFDGGYQHAAVVEARPTANLRGESSQKNLVKRSTVKPVRRTIDAQRELIYVWSCLTNTRPRHLEGIAFRGIMLGHHDRSEALFYYFRLEDQVPENHLVRLIGAYFNKPNDALARRLPREQLEDGGWNCEAVEPSQNVP